MLGKTYVLDAGARYGIHPTWNDFRAELKYFAFEPDPEEAARLDKSFGSDQYSVSRQALGKEQGTARFNIASHKALSSLLEPDVDSQWFKDYRPSTSEVTESIEVEVTTVDAFSTANGVNFDFLKVDTEGTEQDVIEGASSQLESSILGVRSSVNFQRCYVGQKLFSENHEYLLSKGFVLLNMDYAGYGTPKNSFFAKPDPVSSEQHRYGVLINSDAVWVKPVENILNDDAVGSAISALKLACFCFSNSAPDVAVDVLEKYVEKFALFPHEIMETKLYRYTLFASFRFLGKWRVHESENWYNAQAVFNRIFHQELTGGHQYWATLQELERGL